MYLTQSVSLAIKGQKRAYPKYRLKSTYLIQTYKLSQQACH